MELSLTADDPIHVMQSRHSTPAETQYDMHYPLELGIVTSGKMQRLYQDWSVDLLPGQVWLCSVWEPHGYRVIQSPCTAVVCVVQPSFLAGQRLSGSPDRHCLAPFIPPPPQRPQARPDQRERMKDLGSRFSAAARAADNQRKPWLHLLVLEVLLELTAAWIPSRPLRTASADALGCIDRAIRMVFSTRKRIGVAEAARHCGLSRNYFSQLFLEATGSPFSQFTLRYRLSGAAHCLTDTDLAIKAVAQAWGFTDAAHMHRLFVKHFRQSPFQYRQRARK